MSKLAVLFPGQGAQYVGMGQDLEEICPESYGLFDLADEALGFPLTEIIRKGPVEKLNLTAYTQPALLTTSLAYWKALRRRGVRVGAALGLSLGEYGALVAAGSLDFREAIKLVAARGKAMAEAYPADKGAVVVVLGMERPVVEEICDKVTLAGEGVVQAANFNCPGQVVIAGDKEAVEKAAALLGEVGAKRTIPLPVSAPFHTRLLLPAQEAFAPYLAQADMRLPVVPVISNVTGKPYQSVEEMKLLLARQVSEPLEFQAGVEMLLQQGFSHFVELGPGQSLGGMIKKINRQARVYSVASATDIERVANEIKNEGVM